MSTTILTPYSSAVAVTPSDTTVLPVTDGLWVGGAGAIAVVTKNGDTVTLSGVPAGTRLELAVTKVLSTGTVATLITALYR